MLARDVMSKDLITVGSGDPLSKVARAILRGGVSAVPVVDASMRLLGVISDLDLIGQHAPQRAAQLDRWLSHLAEGQTLSNEYVEIVAPNARSAGDIMSRPVISVAETADLAEIAAILAQGRVKRVFVVTGERLVGVVSRTDLARALMNEKSPKPSHRLRVPEPALPLVEDEADEPVEPAGGPPSAAAFQSLVEAHEKAKRTAALREQAARHEARRALVEKLADERFSDAAWNLLLDHARAAAERGERDILAIRFPSALCDDGGRMINVPDPEWPSTLRGPAADVYERWRDELKPRGFGLFARILEFPDGFPGDAGIFLTWGG
jgi:CBS domain-containing protein